MKPNLIANGYVSSVPISLRTNFTNTVFYHRDYFDHYFESVMLFELIPMLEVFNIISSIEYIKASLDKFLIFVYKQLNDVFLPVICQLFNYYFRESKFPSILKTAYVIPIIKKGSLRCSSNYCQISILLVLLNKFKKIMSKQLNKFIDLNNVHENK